MSEKQVIAVDFDGTLCEDMYPYIGKPNRTLIKSLIDIRKKGFADVILYTCRSGEKLEEAIKFCSDLGLEFDAVNQNLPRIIEKFGSDTRKIFADLYIDDKYVDLSYDVVNGSDYEEFYSDGYLAKYYQSMIEAFCIEHSTSMMGA